MLQTGDSYQEEVTFTPQMVQKFVEITGDNNPIHTDANAAFNLCGYSSPPVHGMLAASMFGKVLGGGKFPGQGTINLERSFVFIRPVFAGQTYTMTFKVKEIDAQTHTAVLRCRMKDKDGKICVDCTTKVRNVEQF